MSELTGKLYPANIIKINDIGSLGKSYYVVQLFPSFSLMILFHIYA